MRGSGPPFEINNEMLLLVSAISEKVARIDMTGGLAAQPHLRKNNRIRSIYSSLRIEANSLSLRQVEDVINGRAVLGEQREIREVQNAYAAYEEISKFDPYSMDDLKRMHGIMTKCLISESGEFRQGEEGVFQGERCIFMAPPARLVPQLMADLFCWMRETRDALHPLIQSSVFHYEFVFIHPFSDGNGRMARLWHTALLAIWKPVFAYIPLESQIEKFQEGYYDAIARCHARGESTEFILFMLARIDQVLEEILHSQEAENETLPAGAKRLLVVMECGVPYSSKELMERLGLRSREGFRRNYLRPAIESSLVCMTIPEKPSSKNQRYVRKG